MKVGDKFGLWTVADLPSTVYDRKHNKRKKVRCECVCGLVGDIDFYSLENGKSNGCRDCHPGGRRKHE